MRQLLQREVEKLHQSCVSSDKPVDSGPEPINVEPSCTNDAAAAAAETSNQPSSAGEAESPAVANPCIAVTRTAPQRHYKEITTYGEMLKFVSYSTL